MSNIHKSLLTANEPKICKSKKVVAVLLVNSVRIEIKRAEIKIIKNKFKSPKKFKKLDSSLAKPVETTSDASVRPPPKSIKIFHGISLNQLKFRIDPSLISFDWNKKNRNAPNIAMLESVSSIVKKEFIDGLKTHRHAVKNKIKVDIFSW